MDKITKNVLIILAVIGVGLLGYNTVKLLQPRTTGFASGEWNWIQQGNFFTTTTGSVQASSPVKLLASDANRQYAIITNPSDTGIYLFVTSTENICVPYAMTTTIDSNATNCNASTTSGYANWISATTTNFTDVLKGIYIAAGGSYEILPNKMITGAIWASSTASSKRINVYYK